MTAIQNEEDLLILSDDTQSDSIFDFSFGEETNEVSDVIDFAKEETSTENIISFDEPTASKEEVDIFGGTDLEITKEENTQSDVFVFEEANEENVGEVNIFDTQEDTQELDLGEIIQEENITSNEFREENIQEVVETSETHLDNSFDRSAIIDEAISKMNLRKQSIGEITSSKQEEISALEAQIHDLQNQKNSLELEVKELNKESSTIDLDITAFENMKKIPTDDSKERQRKPNLDKMKK